MFSDHRESLTGSPASQTYVVSAGRVSRRWPVTESRPTTEVVLTGGRRSPEVDWSGVDGVLEVTDQVETITIRVTRECSDTLLRTALEHGWSVTSLGPITERAR
jgi:hypothetical protein